MKEWTVTLISTVSSVVSKSTLLQVHWTAKVLEKGVVNQYKYLP